MNHRHRAIYHLGVAIGHLNGWKGSGGYTSLAEAEFHVSLALLEMTRADPDRVACDMLIAVLEQEKQRRAEEALARAKR